MTRFARKRLVIGTLSTLLLLSTLPVQAEIFKCRDNLGRLHYTDSMKSCKGFKLLWRSSNDPRYASYSRINLKAMKENRRRYSPLIDAVASRTQLEPALLHAVVRAESAYDPRALSRKGAQGLMQLMPATARRYGVTDSWDAEQNLDGGARYLRDLLAMFENDLRLALAAYNAGENAVKKYGNQIPPYPETQDYVKKVIRFFQRSGAVVSAYPTIK